MSADADGEVRPRLPPDLVDDLVVTAADHYGEPTTVTRQRPAHEWVAAALEAHDEALERAKKWKEAYETVVEGDEP